LVVSCAALFAFSLSLYFFNFFSSSSTCAVGCIFIIVGCCGSLLINPLGWNPKLLDAGLDSPIVFDSGLLFGSFGLVVLLFLVFGFST
jgi:hypothetical protein